ncbi:DNA repair RAD51-like protein B [Nymphaea thermarum]|nr:DNA repair RAD51-like protein B [Nymphaea thermarum]
MHHPPLPVEQLEGFGISAADVKKLKDVGFCTVESVTYLPRNDLKNLSLKKGIKKAVINKITEAGMSL